MQDLMQTMMGSFGSGQKPQPKVAAPAGLWGLEVDKANSDDGVRILQEKFGAAADREAAVFARNVDRLTQLHGLSRRQAAERIAVPYQ